MPLEGDIFRHKQAKITDFEDDSAETTFLKQLFDLNEDRHRFPLRPGTDTVKFIQGDACNLNPQLGKFHLIMGANLVDRLRDPRQFLIDVSNYLVPGGYLVLFSPYTWLPEYTPKENWIGGIQVDGENVYTRQGLENHLLKLFEPVEFEITGSGYEDPVYGHYAKGSK